MSRKIKGGFVAIPNVLIDSDIWLQLTGAEIKVYVGAYRKFWKHPEGFTLPSSHFKQLMSNDTLLKSRKKLARLGLIERVHKGGYLRNASLYKLSERWKQNPSAKRRTDQILKSEGVRQQKANQYLPWNGIFEKKDIPRTCIYNTE